MKRAKLFLFGSICAALLLGFTGCKSEKKTTYYSAIYSEKPTVIYLHPTQDNTSRRVEKYPKDVAYNNELNMAAHYFYETQATPLLNKGYYVIGPVASEQIAAGESRTMIQLKHGDLKPYSQRYGIDAVLLTQIHRWVEKNGEWTVYLEYILRSSKTNTDLMHKWVVASKIVPTNLKGDPIIMKSDKSFANRMQVDNGTAQRCFLVEKVNDYILRNLPISTSKRQYEEDLYRSATDTYIKYVWGETGDAEVSSISLEEYEEGCFL